MRIDEFETCFRDLSKKCLDWWIALNGEYLEGDWH